MPHSVLDYCRCEISYFRNNKNIASGSRQVGVSNLAVPGGLSHISSERCEYRLGLGLASGLGFRPALNCPLPLRSPKENQLILLLN